MNRSRRLLVVTDIFPPVAAVGTQRLVGLCRHAASIGWSTMVITMRPRGDAAIDETLLARVPESVRVVRTRAPDLPALAARLMGRAASDNESRSSHNGCLMGATDRPPQPYGADTKPARPGAVKRLAQWLSWWMYVPDSRSAWLPSAVWAGLRGPRPDVIFSSAPMWTSHLVGAVLSRALRVPWVADFRDPWCGSTWRDLPAGLHQSVDQAMERCVVRGAARITCAWDGIRRLLVDRYPGQAARMTTILNGFEPGEIDPVEPEPTDATRCVLIHAGTLYGPRSPVSLLAGLKRLRQDRPAEAARLLVALVGGSSWNGRPLTTLAEEHGVSDLVRVVPPTAHRRAVALLKGADVAILFGQSGHQGLAPVPAKVYEYVASGKAVLSIGSGDEAVDILRRGGCPVWTADDAADSCAAALGQIVLAHGRGDLASAASQERRMFFTRSAMAERLTSVIEDAMRAGYP